MFRLIEKFNVLKASRTVITSYSTYNPAHHPYNPALLPQKKSHRKPRWIPVAKSKRFRVPEKTTISEEETLEIRRLFNNYRTYINSIRRYLINKHSIVNQKSLDPEEILKHFKNDFKICSQINDEWNKEIAAERQQCLLKELQAECQLAEKDLEQILMKEHKKQELAEQLVKQEKEASAHFITPENIDAAIDKALSDVVDYNFAINTDGQKILGRDTKVKVEEKASVKQ